MKKNLGLRKSWWRWGCGSNKKDEQMDGHEVGIEIGLLEKALVQFTASIPLTLFVSTSGLKKEFKAKREIDPVFPCHGGGGGQNDDKIHLFFVMFKGVHYSRYIPCLEFLVSFFL